MEFATVDIDPAVIRRNARIERRANTVIRGLDRLRSRLRVGGRKAAYDDDRYEFVGGASERLRKKHYDKSLRLLWKAEEHVRWSSFRDCTRQEREVMQLADGALDDAERGHVERLRSADFRAMLDAEYTPEQKQAIVNVLSLIGHGEAYAWLVSTEVLNDVKSTGARAALTMQVLEEAKHFVVLRELICAFGCPVPRMSAWEYVLLERTFKAKGLEKFFGMNVIVEGFALSLFGMMAPLPGLEVLRQFHLDESRHTALPANYFSEFPMTWWQSNDPRAQIRRFSMILPALPILAQVEGDLAILGIDSLEFGGSMSRKILVLCERVGFKAVLSRSALTWLLNRLLNDYCKATRPGHTWTEFLASETTTGEAELAVEREVFGVGGVAA